MVSNGASHTMWHEFCLICRFLLDIRKTWYSSCPSQSNGTNESEGGFLYV